MNEQEQKEITSYYVKCYRAIKKMFATMYDAIDPLQRIRDEMLGEDKFKQFGCYNILDELYKTIDHLERAKEIMDSKEMTEQFDKNSERIERF